MKKILVMVCLCLVGTWPSRAQTQEAQQLVLNYQKLLQLEKILDNMYKGYKILSDGYNTIKNIAEGNFTLHQVFLDGLFLVNPSVRNYKRIPQIVQYQQYLMREGRRAFNQFRNDPNLTAREIRYLGKVYDNLFDQSLRNLDELLNIVTASKLRMSDEERLQAIDRIFNNMEQQVAFIRQFNGSTQVLIVQRARARRAVEVSRQLHNVND